MIRRGLILTGGTVHTLDPEQPVVRALMSFNGVIEYIGEDLDLEAMGIGGRKGDWLRVIDLHGRSVIPGLCSLGRNLLSESSRLGTLDLSRIRKASELHAALRTRLENLSAGAWLEAHGLPSSLLACMAEVRGQLDRIAPRNPMILRGLNEEGEAPWGLANSLALRHAVEDPQHGLVAAGVERRGGIPSGRIEGELLTRMHTVRPEPDARRRLTLLENALRRVVSRGITSALDLGGCRSFEHFARLHRTGGLPLRVTTSVLPNEIEACRQAGVVPGFGDPFLRRGGVLLAFGEDARYDLPAAAFVDDAAERRVLAREACDAGLPLWLFAPHPDAVHEALDLLESLPREAPTPALLGVRSMGPKERERLERTGSYISFGGVPTLDGEILPSSLAQSGARVTFGAPPSDKPALDALEALVDAGRGPAWSPGDFFELGEALRANVVEGARLLGLDARLGTLVDGQRADLLILDRDPFLGGESPQLLASFSGGESRYELPGWERNRD